MTSRELNCCLHKTLSLLEEKMMDLFGCLYPQIIRKTFWVLPFDTGWNNSFIFQCTSTLIQRRLIQVFQYSFLLRLYPMILIPHIHLYNLLLTFDLLRSSNRPSSLLIILVSIPFCANCKGGNFFAIYWDLEK